jgi:hypothetical protein
MNNETSRRVIVQDIRMPFVSMVIFMVKWVIASIPALIILWLIAALLMMLFGGLMGGMPRH